jgi:hypothetical protein
LHLATAWIGNSVAVAAKHYLSVTEEDYERAVQNQVPSSTASTRHDWTTVPSEIEKAMKVVASREVMAADS